MKTHRQTEAPLMDLSNRILAVIDDSGEAQQAIKELGDMGMPDGAASTLRGEEGVRRLDADGRHGGRLMRWVRAFQGVNVEGRHLHRYETELEHGHCVVDVPVDRPGLRDHVVAILRAHGGHFVNAYNGWTIEQVAS